MSVIRARDVRERCKGRVDPEVMYCMEALAEQQSVYTQQFAEMAQLLDAMSSIITKYAAVAEHQKSAIDRMNEIGIKEDGGGNVSS